MPRRLKSKMAGPKGVKGLIGGIGRKALCFKQVVFTIDSGSHGCVSRHLGMAHRGRDIGRLRRLIRPGRGKRRPETGQPGRRWRGQRRQWEKARGGGHGGQCRRRHHAIEVLQSGDVPEGLLDRSTLLLVLLKLLLLVLKGGRGSGHVGQSNVKLSIGGGGGAFTKVGHKAAK
ncbi:hypothetical protein TYRP_010280 [Tyrophagus putrescentiae]|nr:hypothetical protein TYRP_010280 [Tyrophagus putrescentiae]